MPAPAEATYDVGSLIAAHTAFRDLIDSHATLPGTIKCRAASDVLLGTATLADPCGTVNGSTGQLTFDVDPVLRDESADTGGDIAYVEICDGDGVVRLALPAQAGTTPVSGKAVFNTLTVAAGGPIEITSVTIG
ncbi:hypothetical protein [Aromatoleum toluclasticum]|uniref:hypothetical protein n=1 Tax=Aromatoleum toluclasticum TaxID=92003 RepID=UPI000375B53C|nr:hypothetical protein [Aromatoleum toluclasticum]